MTVTVRKRDQAAALVVARIADGTLKPGMLAPSGSELAKKTGFAVLTCRAALDILLAKGVLTRVSRSGRARVAGAGLPGDGQALEMGLDLARSLGGWRRRGRWTQRELAVLIGMSESTVCHAETGRMKHSRRFWEKADATLNAGGDLLARYDAWQQARDAEEPGAAGAGMVPDIPVVATVAGVRGGVVVTLPCDPVMVTVRWRDGSFTIVPPGPA